MSVQQRREPKLMDFETEEKLMSTTFSTGQNGGHIINGRGRPTKPKSYIYLTWLDFAESTTLHGLRFISMSNAFLLRRLFWFVLLILCVAIMSYQIVDRVIYYHGNPVNVNVRLIYNQSLSFPSITLCNQNAFRASKAAEMNWYRLIESMYKNPTNRFNSSHLDNYNASQLPVGLLFETAGHMKEDLIVRCSWGDKTCGPENFTAILTDHGLCYTFNHDTSHPHPIVATSTGSDHGLKLLLNVEQYEYMPGPNDAAGIKMLIHDQFEYPRVRELGISVPSGTHAFVGLQVVVIENLPPPYGECNERSLKYFKKYTYDACVLECNLQIYKRKCGCRNFYMPHFDIEDDNPFCTLQQYFDCYVAKSEQSSCDCPNACHYTLFDPTLSYASTSQYSSTKILNSSRFKALKDKLAFARETTHRMEDDKFTEFEEIVEEVNRTFSAMRIIIQQELQEKIQVQIQQLRLEYKTMMENWNMKNTLYRFQGYNIQKNFIRARDAMEERTFNYLCFDFHKFVYLLNAKIQSLQDKTFNGSENRDLIYTLAMNSIDNGMSTSERALSNYTRLYQAYENGTPIFNYKFPFIPRTHNKVSVPKPLMLQALNRNWYARTYGPRMGKDIRQITDLLIDYKVLLNATFYERELNKFQMENLTLTYKDACEDFFHSRSVFYFETIEWPLRVMKVRKSKFDKTQLLYKESYNFIYDNLIRLQYSLTNITTNVIESIAQRIELACRYFHDKSMRKMEVVEGFVEQELLDSLSLLKSFFFEVRNRGQNIYDGWTQLLTKTKAIWRPILEDNDMIEYYYYTNRTEYLVSFFDTSDELDSNFSNFRDTNDVRFVVGTADSSFFHAYDVLKEHLQTFEASTVVDKAVLRENYLELDVFYRELNYEEIEQQIAYDLFALLCDIGGSMGLFVGASVMTIFELIDLFANTSAENLFRHRRK